MRRRIRALVPFPINICIPASQLLRMTDAEVQAALGVTLRNTDEDHDYTAAVLDRAVDALMEAERERVDQADMAGGDPSSGGPRPAPVDGR